MIIEVNTKLLDAFPELNSNQLLFLSIVLDKNQPKYQDIQKVIGLVTDEDIQYLIDNLLIDSMEREDSRTYIPTDKLKEAITPSKDYFDLFYDMYPVYVMRKDGTKCYLRANVNKCRHFFNTKCGKSSAMAEHIIRCLDYEISKRIREGSLSYMMTMWNWLTRSQWEAVEEEMQDTSKQQTNMYGTELI